LKYLASEIDGQILSPYNQYEREEWTVDIAGKAAVVSGGGSGIGRAAVLALVERGAKVIVADIDEHAGRQSVSLVTEKGGAAVFAHCDVTRTEDLASAFACAREQFGRLDIAFNNAGIGGEDLFTDNAGAWKRIIEVDLTAVIDATRLAVREMRRTGHGGVIVNTSSLIGLGPLAMAPVYAAAKAGVVNFSRSLAYLAKEAHIRVNTICPELVDTPMALGLGEDVVTELRQKGAILKPEAIAATVVELVEDDSRAGAVVRITVRGGQEYVVL
jgi:15-hydroxyprostaglandin dehydrogenase (NAD)